MQKSRSRSQFRSQSRDICHFFESLGIGIEKFGLEKSLGIGINKFGLRIKVSVSVLENLVSKKKSQYRS